MGMHACHRSVTHFVEFVQLSLLVVGIPKCSLCCYNCSSCNEQWRWTMMQKWQRSSNLAPVDCKWKLKVKSWLDLRILDLCCALWRPWSYDAQIQTQELAWTWDYHISKNLGHKNGCRKRQYLHIHKKINKNYTHIYCWALVIYFLIFGPSGPFT